MQKEDGVSTLISVLTISQGASPSVTQIDDYAEGSYVITHRSISAPRWESTFPELTKPDLADSIEAMLARRSAGIADAPLSLRTRSYPTDPSSIVTASDYLKTVQAQAQTELDAVTAKSKEYATQKAQAKKQAELDAVQFAEFKRKQQSETKG